MHHRPSPVGRNARTAALALLLVTLASCGNPRDPARGPVSVTRVAPLPCDPEPGGRSLPYLGIIPDLAKWTDGRVRYVYNPTGAPAELSDPQRVAALLSRAFGEWEGVAGLRFEFAGVDPSAVPDDPSDGVVTVGWLSGSFAAQASLYPSCSSLPALGHCTFEDGWIVFNPDVRWDRGAPDLTDAHFVSVAVHEAGHLVGLGHSDNPASVLYADPYNHLPHVRDDDIQAAQALYGPPPSLELPGGYVPPAAPGAAIRGAWVGLDQDPLTPVTRVDEATPEDYLDLMVEVSGGFQGTVRYVWQDPEGYLFDGLEQQVSCAPAYLSCTQGVGLVRSGWLKTFPGVWTAYAIVNGGVSAEIRVEVATRPQWNRPPEATLSVSPESGEAPLRVRLALRVTGDPEGDDVSVIWNLPGLGAERVDLYASTGAVERTLTLDRPGEYELFAQVVDDAARYGTAGSGSEAGSGFRRLFRRVVRVDPPSVTDRDGDAVADAADNCPDFPNPDQTDLDGDGLGDLCDPDRDGDTVADLADNCPDLPNPGQADLDGDDLGDLCDPDRDGDAVADTSDNCPDLPNPDQADLDGDGFGDLCDPDRDGDAVADGIDAFPTDPAASVDTDGDGLPDAWNPGSGPGDSTLGLILDRYPDDKDRWIDPRYPDPGPAPTWMTLSGTLGLPDGPAGLGVEVAVFDPDGVLCGHWIVTSRGVYGDLRVYGDDPSTPGDEGAREGDRLTVKVWDPVARQEWDGAAPVALAWSAGAALSASLAAVDRTPPSVSALPSGGTYGAPRTVTLAAADTVDPEPAVYVTLEGGDPRDTGFRYTDPVEIDRTAELRYVAVDAAGNAGPVAVERYVIDPVPPAVAIASPGPGATREAEPVLEYTVEDATRVTVTVRLDGAEVDTRDGEPLPPLPDGPHTVEVTAVDAAGNTGSARVAFSVDTRAPALTIDPVTTPTSSADHALTGTVEEDASVRASADTGASCGPAAADAGRWTCELRGLAPGDNRITVTATDPAGNTSSATVTIRYEPGPTATGLRIATLQDLPSPPAQPVVWYPDGPGPYASVEIVTQPAHGSASAEGGAVVYAPEPGYTGTDAFTYRVHSATGAAVDGTASVVVYAAVRVEADGDEVTGPVTAEPGARVPLSVSGGSGEIDVRLASAPDGAGGAAVAEIGDGRFEFRVPATGAFAGEYRVEVTDRAAGLSFPVVLQVPLAVDVSAVSIVESDATQTVTVRGGGPGDRFEFRVLGEDGEEGRGDAPARVGPAEARDDPENGNPAVAAIEPADVDRFLGFLVEARDATDPFRGTARTPRITIVPEIAYAGTVVDPWGLPIPGARVTVLDLEEPDGSRPGAVTGGDGRFTIVLPAPFEGAYRFTVTADRYVPVTSSPGDTGGWTVTLVPEQARIEGRVTGLEPQDSAEVYAVCGGERFGPVPAGPAGDFGIVLPDWNRICTSVVASATGYVNGVATNGGAGFDLSIGDVLGLELELLAVPVDREGLEDGVLGGSALLPPERLRDGFRVDVGDHDDPALADRRVTVEVPPGDLDLPEVSEARLVVATTDPADPGLSAGTGGRLYAVDLALVDGRGAPVAPRDAGPVLTRAVVTVPFDVSVVPPGSFESGAWAVHTAATAAGYGTGDREAVDPGALLAVDYLRGEVTLEVGLPRVIGVEPAAPPPLETDERTAAVPETREASSGGGGGGGGGCFVRALFR